MSKNTSMPNMLKPSEVSKKIISKPHKTRSHLEWFDHMGKYRDEYMAEYQKKKNEFLAAAETYNKLNIDTLVCRNIRLHQNYEEMLNLDFLKEKEREEEECDPFCCCLKCKPNKTGRLLRERSLRQMTYIDEPKSNVCLIEPWFKRYLTLNKFIWAARTIIIQNRLLKVLDKLKCLTITDIRTIENDVIEKRCEDYHCHPVFLRFM